MKIPSDTISGVADWDFSAMMIGSGDARHLYSSLIDISTQLGKETGSSEKQNKSQGVGIHFTLVSA